MSDKRCPIDDAPMTRSFTARVLSKYDVGYFQCPECQLLQTEAPYWLSEAYQTSYTSADTGIAARNWHNRFRMEAALHLLFHAQGAYLDIGGGCGLFARLMRDIGIDCYTTDRYAANLFARAFEPPPRFRPTALFAFEVLEHVADPFGFLREETRNYDCRTVFFTTETFQGPVPDAAWPFYGFDHGQHVSFYTPQTLDRLAAALGCRHLHLFSDLHLFTPLPPTPRQRFLLTHRLWYFFYAGYVRFKRRKCSFTQSDSLLSRSRTA